jgi:hypothetical protein
MHGFEPAGYDYESFLQHVVGMRRTDYPSNKASERRLNAAKQGFERVTIITLRPQNPLRLLS